MAQKLRNAFEPVYYAFRTFFTQGLFAYVLFLGVINIIAEVLTKVIFAQIRINIDVIPPSLFFLVILVALTYQALIWTALCILSLDVHDARPVSFRRVFLSIRIVQIIIIFLGSRALNILYDKIAGMLDSPAQLILFYSFIAPLLILIDLVYLTFPIYYIIDKNIGVINALKSSYKLIRSGGKSLWIALLLISFISMIPTMLIPFLGTTTTSLLVSLGFVYLYRKFSINS